jgi:hypothetical protein
MIRGIIIEGLSTAGKSSVFSAIKRLHNQIHNGENTIVAISEHYSQVLHSYHGVLRSMDKDEHIQLLKRHVDYLEQQYNWIESLGHTKPSNGVFYLLERFHVNHRAAFINSAEIEILEKRLSRMEAHCVLLTLTQESVEPRFIESRGEVWEIICDGEPLHGNGGMSEILGGSGKTSHVCETIANSHFRDKHR